MSTNDVSPLPQYQSHKKVRALKISHWVDDLEDTLLLFFQNPAFEPIRIRRDWYGSKVGSETDPGYYVVYEDGYASWSPTKAFEGGYTLIESN